MRLAGDLLKAILVVLFIATTTLAILLQSANEQNLPRQVAEDERCPPPQGWSAHLVQVGENLTTIAEIVRVEPAELVIANCLLGDLHPGDTIFIPPPQFGENACGPPGHWVLYEIQPGDSLPLLAERFSISEASLWHANCILESMTFQPGFRIYVPPLTENR